MPTRSEFLASINKSNLKENIPEFRSGDTVRVHARIIEGTKERIQIFEGVVIRRHKGVGANATFTVRKISYNIGVERTFLLHSPRIDQIEVMSRGKVRRSRLFYLRDVRGKASRIKTQLESAKPAGAASEAPATEKTGKDKASGKSKAKISKADAAKAAEQASA